MSELKDKILKEYQDGNIIVATHEGLMGMKLEDFIKNDAESILYDLNRSELVVLTFIDDPKWVNDYAVAKVIRALKDHINKLEGILKNGEMGMK